jgi:hypothetical protein
MLDGDALAINLSAAGRSTLQSRNLLPDLIKVVRRHYAAPRSRDDPMIGLRHPARPTPESIAGCDAHFTGSLAVVSSSILGNPFKEKLSECAEPVATKEFDCMLG